MHIRGAGMTLVELLFVLAVMTVLASLAVPAVQNLVDRSRHETIVQSVLVDLALVRSEALRQGKLVVMCASRGDGSCDASSEWKLGRMLFVDLNGNGWREGLEPVIAIREGMPNGWSIAGNGPIKRYVAYHPSGRTVQSSGAMQMGTLTICGRKPDEMSHQIIINGAGRPRLKRAGATVCS